MCREHNWSIRLRWLIFRLHTFSLFTEIFLLTIESNVKKLNLVVHCSVAPKPIFLKIYFLLKKKLLRKIHIISSTILVMYQCIVSIEGYLFIIYIIKYKLCFIYNILYFLKDFIEELIELLQGLETFYQYENISLFYKHRRIKKNILIIVKLFKV